MHSDNHGCCGHGRSETLEDERFADDEFTQAAYDEQRMRGRHAHGTSLFAAIFGGLFLAGILRLLFGRRR